MTVLFAASPSYGKATRFVLDAMRHVWEAYPECRLVLTGYAAGDSVISRLVGEGASRNVLDRVDLVGYVPREGLLSRYCCSHALLAPLFDDVESQARFPTKIGEYLASARPVVTNSVGEVPKYLADRQSAYICRPDDSGAYGAKIAEVLADPASAEKVGLAGRRIAEEFFQYSLYSEYLVMRIASLCKAPSGRHAT